MVNGHVLLEAGGAAAHAIDDAEEEAWRFARRGFVQRLRVAAVRQLAPPLGLVWRDFSFRRRRRSLIRLWVVVRDGLHTNAGCVRCSDVGLHWGCDPLRATAELF